MGWTHDPIPTGVDWQSASFLNEFVDAINERYDVIGVTLPLEQVKPGDDVQDHAFIRSLQVALEELVTLQLKGSGSLFRFTGVRPDTFDVEDIDGLGGAVPYTLSTWRDDAQIHADGFTRRFPREIEDDQAAGTPGQVARNLSDGAIYEHDGAGWVLAEDQSQHPDIVEEHGLCQAGDYIGVWIWQELQRGINQLMWRCLGTWLTLPVVSVSHWGGAGETQGEAEGDWQEIVGGAAAACAHAVFGDGYASLLRRRDTRRFTFAFGQTSLSDARVWVLATSPGEFLANGDGFNEDEWNLVFSGPADETTEFQTNPQPVDTMPEWGSQEDVTAGWTLSSILAAIATNDFEYGPS